MNPHAATLKQTLQPNRSRLGRKSSTVCEKWLIGDANQLNALLWPRVLSALETNPVRAAEANHAADAHGKATYTEIDIFSSYIHLEKPSSLKSYLQKLFSLHRDGRSN